MSDQSIATMGSAETYGLAKNPALKETLERAVKLIRQAQNPALGGSRYQPEAKPATPPPSAGR